MRVTRGGALLAAGSVLALVAGRLFALPEVTVLAVTGLALVAVAVAWVAGARPALAIGRSVQPARVHLGAQSRLDLTVRNTGRRRSPPLLVTDAVPGTVGARVAVPPLAPGCEHHAAYRLPTDRRGLLVLGPLEVEAGDPFGIAARRTRLAGEATLTVLPAVERLGGTTSTGGIGDPLGGISHIVGGTGDEDFATLRPYVVGDDLRRVHWASTARTGELVVRQDDPPWQGNLTVLLDARERRTGAERFEVAVSAAASLLHTVALRGDRARLVLTDGTDTGMVDARAARDTLLEHLAVVGRHPGDDLPPLAPDAHSRSGALVVVSGAPDPVDCSWVRRLGARFGVVRLVVVEPGAAVDPGPPVEVVRVGVGVPFARAWASAAPLPARPTSRSRA